MSTTIAKLYRNRSKSNQMVLKIKYISNIFSSKDYIIVRRDIGKKK